MSSYYVDSCIYLNLWQKEEVGSKKLWKYAKDFFNLISDKQEVIYYSGFLLKELMFILTIEEYLCKIELFSSQDDFQKVYLTEKELRLAKEIKKLNQKTSLYDIIHLILAKKTDSILVTRDRDLIKLAKFYNVDAKKPEEIINC